MFTLFNPLPGGTSFTKLTDKNTLPKQTCRHTSSENEIKITPPPISQFFFMNVYFFLFHSVQINWLRIYMKPDTVANTHIYFLVNDLLPFQQKSNHVKTGSARHTNTVYPATFGFDSLTFLMTECHGNSSQSKHYFNQHSIAITML